MNRILIATIIVLLSGTSLAFAKSEPISNADLTALHCNLVPEQLSNDRSAYKSEAAFQASEDKALSLCRQDMHREDKQTGRAVGSRHETMRH